MIRKKIVMFCPILLLPFMVGIMSLSMAKPSLPQQKEASKSKLPTHLDTVIARLKLIEPDMVKIKGGTFKMGCNKEDDSHCRADEQPVHKVTVGNFALCKFQVTIAQFELFINETGYRTDADKEGNSCVPGEGTWVEKANVNWRDDQNGNRYPDSVKLRMPVSHVSWNDAVAYCHWLSSLTGKHYRLPTEAEWEYAAKGGKLSEGYMFSGCYDLGTVGWYNENSDYKIRPVGQKLPNELGLYDMTGNSWNWCSDWYGKDYYKISPQNAPTGPDTGECRVWRGGSWYCNEITCRITIRICGMPNDNGGGSGFRVACDY
jgi:formylglycine-generating enzyme